MSKDTISNSITGEIKVSDELGNLELEVPSKRHEILAVIATVSALVISLALISYDGIAQDASPIAGGNIIGPVGTWTGFVFFTVFGASAYIINLIVWLFAVCLFTGYAQKLNAKSVIGIMTIALLSSIAMHLLLSGILIAGGHDSGGIIGSVAGEFLVSIVSIAGTYIVVFGSIILVLLIITDISLFLVGRAIGLLMLKGAKNFGHICLRVAKAWNEECPADEKPANNDLAHNNNESAISKSKDSIVKDKKQKTKQNKTNLKELNKDKDKEQIEDKNKEQIEDKNKEQIEDKNKERIEEKEPKIVTKKLIPKPKNKPNQTEELQISQSIKGNYTLPPLSLLQDADPSLNNIDTSYLKDQAEKLSQVLADFNVLGEVLEIQPGPVVTMFEFQPQSGTKLSKIGGLSNEIAMALEVTKVRVVAPIPGKNAVGFELPNIKREMVRLKEILEDDEFSNTKSKLPMALGKDIAGTPYVVDLAKMPHLLMAGTTGSGKSVSVNTMLISFLFRYTPENLRLLLIDPKMIEFQPYNHIPHLLLPVVTDMSQACLALKWAVDEMERRYQLFADLGSRNLESYNAKIEKILEKAKNTQHEPAIAAQTAMTENGNIVEFGEVERKPEKLPEKLPLIVICIDELADLMMVAAKDVEVSIARLAQKARASGLHLIVATQRPSTDVVTGLIKANFPARLSCQVSSGIDSRTILGTNGAEHLLGNGDMLIVPPGTSNLKRVQGAFVTEDEVTDIVAFLKKQGVPSYDEEILKPREDENKTANEEEKDEVYDDAVAVVAEAQACSISMIQRKLRIGYNRAARIVETMESERIIGPANGVNKREVFISPQ